MIFVIFTFNAGFNNYMTFVVRETRVQQVTFAAISDKH
ncbi:hypothetical protein GA0116948_10581 [Chitinophaga costaii]|uniref:Uncharacterized protein n=1 Tax=Chitinophaga costaii TaxID=1335309 RepID=A0A1C4D5T5_9BACT|nr:hypothetical protein GA0116948_10581 [Chitinophaga costaii]